MLTIYSGMKEIRIRGLHNNRIILLSHRGGILYSVNYNMTSYISDRIGHHCQSALGLKLVFGEFIVICYGNTSLYEIIFVK